MSPEHPFARHIESPVWVDGGPSFIVRKSAAVGAERSFAVAHQGYVALIPVVQRQAGNLSVFRTKAVVQVQQMRWLIVYVRLERRPEHNKPGRDLGCTRYAKMAEALGRYAEYVEEPEDIRPALKRAWSKVEEGMVGFVSVKTLPRSRHDGAF